MESKTIIMDWFISPPQAILLLGSSTLEIMCSWGTDSFFIIQCPFLCPMISFALLCSWKEALPSVKSTSEGGTSSLREGVESPGLCNVVLDGLLLSTEEQPGMSHETSSINVGSVGLTCVHIHPKSGLSP